MEVIVHKIIEYCSSFKFKHVVLDGSSLLYVKKDLEETFPGYTFNFDTTDKHTRMYVQHGITVDWFKFSDRTFESIKYLTSETFKR